MDKQRRAIIIGGSLGGLFAAHFLRRAGWRTDIYERTPTPLTGRGAGLVTHPEIASALTAIGIDPSRNLGVLLEKRVVVDQQDREIAAREHPQIATSWNRLFEMLHGAYPSATYHLGKDLVGIEQTAGGVTARFADGSAAAADLLVGADGFRSAVRALLLPDVAPLYAGYIAWRGMAPETLFREPADQNRFDLFTFTLPPGEQMLGYPVAGVNNDMRRGYRSYNFVWYLPADEARDVPRLLTDRNGHTHSLSIPPPLIAPEVVSEMRAHASNVLSPWFQRVVNIIEQPFLQPIYDLTSPRMAFGRIALVGDAAFVIRPHVGAGVVKAAEDAAALSRLLGTGGDIAARLEAYSTERSIVGNRIVEQARRLGCYLKHSFATDAERRYAEERGAPMTVLKETGSLAFMRA